MKEKKIINIINFPGSGTHFMIDLMAVLKIPHNPVLDVIIKILQLSNNKHLKIIDLDVKRKRIFQKIYKQVQEENAIKDIKVFARIIENEILNKISENSFIMLPQVFYAENNYNLSIKDLDTIKKILSYLNNKNQSFTNIIYLRHPNDIFNSKMKRFFDLNDKSKVDNEISQIISFFNYNESDIKKNYIRYEDLIINKKKTINKISSLFDIKDHKILNDIKHFHIYKTSKNYKNLYDFNKKIKFLHEIYYENNNNYFFNSYLIKNLDQIKIIYSFLINKNYFNDAAFHRTKRTFFSKILIRMLLLIPKIKNNYIKITSHEFREKNKNIISGI